MLQFNSRNSLGCWVRQSHALKQVSTCSNLGLHESQTKWVFVPEQQRK